MRTLDEVIFEAPYTMTPWEENAIYYLKEYRDHMKNEIIELQEEVKKQKEMIEFLEKPLTWYELKQMEGKPIWIEYDSPSAKYKRWVLLCEYTDSNKITIIANHLLTQIMPDDYGKTWQAYRKERS